MAATDESRGSGRARPWLWIAAPLLSGLAVALVAMWGYLELAEDLVLSPRIAAFDTSVGAIVQGWQSPALTVLMRGATWSAAGVTVSVCLLLLVAILMWSARYRDAVLMVVILAGGMALSVLGKQITERPRPPAAQALIELPTSFSFPSGHTLAALLLWACVAFAVLRSGRRGWVRAVVVFGGLLLVVLVGTSRVYLGVHWPSDIAASWLLGIAWLSLTVGAFLSWERSQAERRS